MFQIEKHDTRDTKICNPKSPFFSNYLVIVKRQTGGQKKYINYNSKTMLSLTRIKNKLFWDNIGKRT